VHDRAREEELRRGPGVVTVSDDRAGVDHS
jgi:hypothetical protein